MMAGYKYVCKLAFSKYYSEGIMEKSPINYSKKINEKI